MYNYAIQNQCTIFLKVDITAIDNYMFDAILLELLHVSTIPRY